MVARERIGTGVAGFVRVVDLIAAHGGRPADTPVAIETDKNLPVVALAGAGFTVYPINPRAVARNRERHNQARGTSDPGDTCQMRATPTGWGSRCHESVPPSTSTTALARPLP